MPHTIAENLQRLQAAKTAIGNAIVAKGGTVGANDGLEEYPADIATIPSGGITPAVPKDVNFYDYDGTCVYSYTADEFAELTTMPANPSHVGLTAQGWNWSLADAKEYVADYGKLIIGQMYITSDGKTRIYINLTEGRLSPWLKLYLNANSELDIDWGDGSTHSSFTSTSADYVNEKHDYASAGDYVIAITVVSGSFAIQSAIGISSLLTDNKNSASSSDLAYINSIQRIEIGEDCGIGGNAFRLCNFSSITLPSSIGSLGGSSFYAIQNKIFVAIPDNCTMGYYVFQACNVTLSVAKNISRMPENLFRDSKIRFITIPPNCGLGYGVFMTSTYLSDVIFAEGATSTNQRLFYYCYSLKSVTFPSTITTIDSECCSNCTGLGSIKFKGTTPPTISNVNAWTNVPSDCYILVPYDTLDDYLNTTNMPDDSTYLYLCYAKYANGAELPATSTDGYSLTWYATKDDARAGTNPITVGNGKEVYAIGA